ncbi:MAG: response regulator transcription factor [Chromatiaceae bacterium]
MATARKILIVEDDADIARLLQLHLTDMHYETEVAADGETALRKARSGGYDLVILDLMLPGVDGTTVCQRLRAMPGYVPILMLTAKSSELDRVVGLEVGADDYVTKPFSVPEVLARVKALLRRVDALGSREPNAVDQETLCRGGLRIDFGRREVHVDDRNVTLTAREFELLAHFARHPGRVFTRAQLLDQVWGYGHEGYEHTVNTHINRLRAKIEQDAAVPRYILTVWGVGYKFAETSG